MASYVEQATFKVTDLASGPLAKIDANLKKLAVTARALAQTLGRLSSGPVLPNLNRQLGQTVSAMDSIRRSQQSILRNDPFRNMAQNVNRGTAGIRGAQTEMGRLNAEARRFGNETALSGRMTAAQIRAAQAALSQTAAQMRGLGGFNTQQIAAQLTAAQIRAAQAGVAQMIAGQQRIARARTAAEAAEQRRQGRRVENLIEQRRRNAEAVLQAQRNAVQPIGTRQDVTRAISDILIAAAKRKEEQAGSSIPIVQAFGPRGPGQGGRVPTVADAAAQLRREQLADAVLRTRAAANKARVEAEARRSAANELAAVAARTGRNKDLDRAEKAENRARLAAVAQRTAESKATVAENNVLVATQRAALQAQQQATRTQAAQQVAQIGRASCRERVSSPV